MNIGLFGGSFNPIHNGHVRLAKTLLQEAGLDEVWFMVSPQNPFKQNQQLLDDNKRFRLVQIALKDEPHLKACNFEFNLPKPSYTWNTLQALQEAYPNDQFTILIGGDNWAAFDKWYRYEDILQRYPIVVYPREGSEVTGFEFQVPNIKIVKTPLINISSTQIRQRIQAGKSVRGLVPTGVAMVLEQEHLYR
ncbi:MAG: nicotinate-nucleotide adenylyltransferase [Prevotella sp.]|nr:nicotinate-nucleotide adenylyltransferase [Prevotella sp.]